MRGPLSAWGSGVATITILSATGFFPNQLLYVIICITSICMTLSCCPTQSWTQWAINYSKLENKSYIKSALPWCWLIGAINIAIAYFVFA